MKSVHADWKKEITNIVGLVSNLVENNYSRSVSNLVKKFIWTPMSSLYLCVRVTTKQLIGGLSEYWYTRWQPATLRSLQTSRSRSMRRLCLAKWGSHPTSAVTWKNCCDICCKSISPRDSETSKTESTTSKVTSGSPQLTGLPSTNEKWVRKTLRHLLLSIMQFVLFYFVKV